jgi:hypothetical protein
VRSRRADNAAPVCRRNGHNADTAKAEAIGGWRFGNTINGAQAEYLLCRTLKPTSKIPDELTDER